MFCFRWGGFLHPFFFWRYPSKRLRGIEDGNLQAFAESENKMHCSELKGVPHTHARVCTRKNIIRHHFVSYVATLCHEIYLCHNIYIMVMTYIYTYTTPWQEKKIVTASHEKDIPTHKDVSLAPRFHILVLIVTIPAHINSHGWRENGNVIITCPVLSVILCVAICKRWQKRDGGKKSPS